MDALSKLKTLPQSFRFWVWLFALVSIWLFVLVLLSVFNQRQNGVSLEKQREVRPNQTVFYDEHSFANFLKNATCYEWPSLSNTEGNRVYQKLFSLGWSPSQELFEKQEPIYRVALPSRYGFRTLAYQKWLNMTSSKIRAAGFPISVIGEFDYPAGGILLKTFSNESEAKAYLAQPEIRRISEAAVFPVKQDNLYQRIFISVGAGIVRDNFDQTLAMFNIEQPQECLINP